MKYENVDEKYAPMCDDQLPMFSHVGRGLRGDGYKIEMIDDGDALDEKTGDRETYLQGYIIDHIKNIVTPDPKWNENGWEKRNINGGIVRSAYTLRPYTNPKTFNLTFWLDRPNRTQWSYTTPSIPYVDTIGDNVGNGVANVFFMSTEDMADGNGWDRDWENYIPTSSDAIYWNKDNMTTQSAFKNSINKSKTTNKHTYKGYKTYYDYITNKLVSLDSSNKNVLDKMVYPNSWKRSAFHAPKPGDPYTVNCSYGLKGDLDCATTRQLSKIVGISPSGIETYGMQSISSELPNELKGKITITIGTEEKEYNYSGNNIKKYIDEAVKAALNASTDYTDYEIEQVEQKIISLDGKYKKSFASLFEKIPGQSSASIKDDGTIQWKSPMTNNNTLLTIGDINVYSGNEETFANVGSSTHGLFAHTSTSANNDIKAI